ncbi:uncharacterized protein LOC124620321 [Schistocerca americana]|uniref:uncharacterized protein LOC124620321 n=1 Tax=Schistocerca americana TaxID=7009 RepID=UPI001F4F28CA|nr:uncharacterized protein LOC124620321 [Schistocerca americana]
MATLEELRKTVEELLARNTRLESELQARTTRADAVANLADRVHDALTTAPSTAAAAAYDSVPPPPWRPAPPAPASDADLHQLVQNLTAQVAALSTQVDRLARSQQEGSTRRSGSRPGDRRRGSRNRQRSNSRFNDASLPRDAVAPTLAERLRSHMAGLRAHAPTRHGTGKIFVHADLQRCTHVMLRTDAVRPPLRPPYSGPHRVIARGDKTLVLECNGKPSTVSVDRVKPAYVLPAPSATHFFDPAEDLFTDDTPSASGQTEPAPGAAGDAQLQPAVIALPRAPPSTMPRQLVRPPGPRPPQAHRSPPPQPPADYVTRAGRRVRFKRPCCVASAPLHPNRQSRVRAAERRQNSAPTSRRPL